MPKYFFHIEEVDSTIIDGDGFEFADDDEAIKEAKHAIVEFALEAARHSRDLSVLGLTICDVGGAIIAELRSDDVLLRMLIAAWDGRQPD